eukprot:Selendium_serpulae@DN2145_c0_g1_i1.p2
MSLSVGGLRSPPNASLPRWGQPALRVPGSSVVSRPLTRSASTLPSPSAARRSSLSIRRRQSCCAGRRAPFVGLEVRPMSALAAGQSVSLAVCLGRIKQKTGDERRIQKPTDVVRFRSSLFT